MKIKYTKRLCDGSQFSYGEKGRKVTGQRSIVLIHGFTADHFMWAPIVQNIPSTVHVIALDLPGHGFSTDPAETEDISYPSLVKRVKQFFDIIELNEPVHLVGMSLGGALSGIFAAEYSHLVGALTLICPAMKCPYEAPIIKENKEAVSSAGGLTIENCPMLPQTALQVKEMLDYSHYATVRYPTQILKGVADMRIKRNDFYLRLVNVIISEDSQELLEINSPKISCPTQVIWGQNDMIVDVSGADILREKLPNCSRVDVLDKCGHAVNLDQPERVAQVLQEFWEDHQIFKC